MDRIQREANGALHGWNALPPEEVIFGRSEAMDFVRKRVSKVAAANVPLLIQGEGGTGKEVLARWIHERSAVKGGEFVKSAARRFPGRFSKVNYLAMKRALLPGPIARSQDAFSLQTTGRCFWMR